MIQNSHLHLCTQKHKSERDLGQKRIHPSLSIDPLEDWVQYCYDTNKCNWNMHENGFHICKSVDKNSETIPDTSVIIHSNYLKANIRQQESTFTV